MKWHDFEYIIGRHITEYGADDGYSEWLRNGVWQTFYSSEFTTDAEEIVRFAKEWGMARVIGQISKANGGSFPYDRLLKAAEASRLAFNALKQQRFPDFRPYETINGMPAKELVTITKTRCSHLSTG